MSVFPSRTARNSSSVCRLRLLSLVQPAKSKQQHASSKLIRLGLFISSPPARSRRAAILWEPLEVPLQSRRQSLHKVDGHFSNHAPSGLAPHGRSTLRAVKYSK